MYESDSVVVCDLIADCVSAECVVSVLLVVMNESRLFKYD